MPRLTRTSGPGVRRRTAAALVVGSLVIPGSLLLEAGAAHADSSSDITFDEGSSFTNWGQGHVTIDGFNGDGIQSEGTAPTGLGDAMQAIFGAATGWDFPVNVKSWIEGKVMEAIDGLISVEPVQDPVQEERVDGGVPSGGTSQNEDDADTAVAQNGQPDEETSDDTEDPDGPDGACTGCPDESALPNPDSDGGPTGPASYDTSTLVSVPTDDGGGPEGPASFAGSLIAQLGVTP